MVEVDPSYKSQMCPHCGYTSKANRVGYYLLQARRLQTLVPSALQYQRKMKTY
ncbi:MAG: hypothetical protein WED04_13340 [Promethearchaeati archaeon SRVP18_Atabeyarchaeia-1]